MAYSAVIQDKAVFLQKSLLYTCTAFGMQNFVLQRATVRNACKTKPHVLIYHEALVTPTNNPFPANSLIRIRDNLQNL